MKRILLKHVGNMGDHVFFIPPVLEQLKLKYPDSHITLVTAWGYKTKNWRRQQFYGQRNQSGFCIALMMTNPHIDQLVHWHDTKLSLEANICHEEGQKFPTWSKKYFDKQKELGNYDLVAELDFGLGHFDNPIQKMYETCGINTEPQGFYQTYFTDQDLKIAQQVMQPAPKPRIVLCEGLERTLTLGWDPDKIPQLEQAIRDKYKVDPIWFGGRTIPYYQGRQLTLRENIATLQQADIAIGVLSGPYHLAVSAGIPTLLLYCDQPLHRGAASYHCNHRISDQGKQHRTLLGPSPEPQTMLKSDQAPTPLTPAEQAQQNYQGWQNPGCQSTKSCLAPITVDEVMTVIDDMLSL